MSGGRIKVLLIAECESEVPRLASAIAAGSSAQFDLRCAPGTAEALSHLGSASFDAVLLDIARLGGDQGIARITRLHEHAPDVPIIVLTPEDDDALAVRALKAGAQDSLVKGQVSGSLLVRAIRYAIERHQLQVALQAMALVDDLTGLYNRRGFQTLARQQLKTADRIRKRVSFIFVDLDGLKVINDTFGHREGDLALMETADLLKETFRESDIIARIGGDEFVVLAMENSGQPDEQWAARLRERLRARNASPERRFPLSLSMGVAYYDPDFPSPLDDLLHHADVLMYAEKRSKQATPPLGVPTYIPGQHPSTPAPRAD
jgi:diguanylate cyclase (GGDEF)-like protein